MSVALSIHFAAGQFGGLGHKRSHNRILPRSVAPRGIEIPRYSTKSPPLPFRTGVVAFRLLIEICFRFRWRDHFTSTTYEVSLSAVARRFFVV